MGDARVDDLQPGDLVFNSLMSATFVARTTHPIWPHLQLVVWRMADGSWSHDALDARQVVGSVLVSDGATRTDRLRAALLGGGE